MLEANNVPMKTRALRAGKAVVWKGQDLEGQVKSLAKILSHFPQNPRPLSIGFLPSLFSSCSC